MRRRRCSALALALLPARHGDCLPLPGSRRRLFASVPAQYESLRRDPALFQPEAVDTWLDPRFQKMVEAVRDADATGEDAMDVALSHVTAEARDLYSFPLLTEDACERLLCEVEAFQTSGLPARRPNSMNNYGLVLNEIGLKPSLSALQQLVHEIASQLFPIEGERLMPTPVVSLDIFSLSLHLTNTPALRRAQAPILTTTTPLWSPTAPTRTEASTCTPTIRT